MPAYDYDKMFDDLDTNHNGYLTLEELAKISDQVIELKDAEPYKIYQYF